MKTTVKIIRKSAKQIQTKYGLKTKFDFLCSTPTGQNWISVWENPKVQAWREGDSVDMDITTREYNGKTYYDGKAYEVSINEVHSLLLEIRHLLMTKGMNSKPVAIEPPPPSDEDYNPGQDGDLPF